MLNVYNGGLSQSLWFSFTISMSKIFNSNMLRRMQREIQTDVQTVNKETDKR
jgi:hypothetical protein